MQLEQPTNFGISNGATRNFGSLTVGSSQAFTFTIRNLTADWLQLTGLPKVAITGDTEDFLITASPATNIGPNSTSPFTLVFTPRGGGVRSATLTIVNTSNVTPYIVYLTGTGTGASEISVEQPSGTTILSGGSKDFGARTIGTSSSHQFTIRNTGDVTLSLTGSPKVVVTGHTEDFLITASPASTVAASGSSPFTLLFAPRASGVRSATLSIANSDSDENPYTINVTGTGTGASEIDVEYPSGTSIASGGSVNFGSQLLGSSTSNVFTIRNTGDVTLSLTGSPKVAVTGHTDDFFISTSPAGTVAASGSSPFTLVFQPRASGVRSATLSIANGDSDENPYTINVTGAGTGAPEIDVEYPSGTSIASGGSVNFGSQLLGSSTNNIFSIRNTGDVTLSLTGSPKVVVTGHTEDFLITASPADTVLAGGSSPFTLVFAPRASGVRSATLSIANGDSDENPYTINVTGTGTGAPEIDVQYPSGTSIASGGSVNFGSLALDSSTNNIFTIRNTGDVTLSLNGSPIVVVTGHTEDFYTSTSPANTVLAGGSSPFTLVFQPRASGVRSATLSIANGDSDENPYTINVTGTGTTVSPEIVVEQPEGTVIASGSTKSFGSQTINTTTIHTFKVLNTGSGSLSLPGIPKVAVTGHTDDFIVFAYPGSPVSAGSFTSFSVHFTPRVNGTRTAILSIPNTDSDENPYTITLTGTGTGGIERDTYIFNIQVISLPTIFNREVSPPCPRVNAWAAPSTVDSIRTSPISYTVELTPPVGQPAGVDIFTWTGDQTIYYAADGPYTASTSFAGENSDQTKTQIMYQNSPGTYTILIDATTINAPEIAVEYGDPVINYNSGSPAVNFGTQIIGVSAANRTFTIRNTGVSTLVLNSVNITGDSDFEIISPPANNINVGSSSTLIARFTPKDSLPRARNATITINNNDNNENTFTIALSGTSAKLPFIDIGVGGVSVGSGTTKSFGSVALGSSTDITFDLLNLGDLNLSLTDITVVPIAGANSIEFTVISFPSTTVGSYLGTGGNYATFAIRFKPLALGTRTARLAIASDASNIPIYTIDITGTATAGTPPPPPSNVFTIDYVIPGNKYRLIAGASLVKSLPPALPFVVLYAVPGNGQPVTFAWDIIPSIDQDAGTPAGTYTGSGNIIRILEAIPEQQINVVSYANTSPPFASYGFYTPNSNNLITVGGAAFVTEPEIVIEQPSGADLVSGTTYNFGQIDTGTDSSRTFRIRNIGTATLSLSNTPPVQISGPPDFTITAQPLSSVAAGNSTTFTVRFLPLALGNRNATITIINNDSSEGTFTIPLVGSSGTPSPSTTVPPTTLGGQVSIVNILNEGDSAEESDLREARRAQVRDVDELEQIRIKTNKALVNTYKIERESVRNYGEDLLQEDTARLKQELEEALQRINNNNGVIDREAILREIINKNRGLAGLPPVTKLPANVVDAIINESSYNEALASILASTFLYHSSNNYSKRSVAI
jgi:hypothetical protein